MKQLQRDGLINRQQRRCPILNDTGEGQLPVEAALSLFGILRAHWGQ